jgi:sec-independent protein translocase protein TatC
VKLVPFLIESPLFGVAFALTVVIYVGNLVALSYWARAAARAGNGSVFRIFLFLLTGFGLVYYVWVRCVRNDWEPRTKPADRRERVVTAYSLAVLLSFVVGAYVTPPDPMSQVMAFPTLFVVSFVVSYLLVRQGPTGGSGDTAS